MASRELQAQCEKAARSVVRGRMLIGAEQYEAAAAAAKAAHGETSFVTVTLALKASEAHFALAREPVTPADRETAWANGSTSWMVADAALRVRAAAGTLLPPSCSPEEAAFKAWFANALQCASGGAPFPPALASQLGAAVGYAAAWQSSYLAAIWMHPGLFGSTFSVSEHARKLGEASMLYALSLAPLSRTFLTSGTMEETQVAASLAHMLVPPTSASLRPAFLAALRAAYHGADVVAALSSRGVIANVRVLPVQEAALEATHVADRAKKGLRVCGLPSCGRREVNVFDFKQCSICRSAVYCSAEHSEEHWPIHRVACKAKKKKA